MGTRIRRNSSAMEHKDHPHAYGDKQNCFGRKLCRKGSSPRVWGQVSLDIWYQFDSRIIPTRMGTRSCCRYNRYIRTDHPHAYGDKSYIRHSNNTIRGIIPTRMGTSKCISSCVRVCWDHPHAYGDKFYRLPCIYIALGSSPRVWGQVKDFGIPYSFDRIIPTRMGTRYLPCGYSCCVWDHPHAYGDKLNTSNLCRCRRGSSPRVWGQVRI